MATHNKKLAFVFPGQGSQSVGMMQGWGERPDVRDTFIEASDALGLDLWAMVADGPIELLNQTVNTQPAMLAADIAAWRVWQAAGGATPALMAGHSLGEYAALVAAGVLGFADAIRLVRFRAEAMQAAVPEGVGAMAAILGMEDDVVRAVCSEAAAGEIVEAVNFNSPGQVVIAGNKAAVERAMVLAKEKGAKRALPLPVSVPSHSSLMLPAAEKLLAYLQGVTITTSLIPVLHNTDVHSHADADAIRVALARQLHTPVRWVETVQAIKAAGIDRVIECGPGRVLAGLNKRIDDSLPAVALVDEASLAAALNQ
ncbi:MAG TPA: ACP S-malonyltransferase [Thiobacillus sp.]|nr:MAG: [acyl-carrier-protein] S-malonyltransferase [Hydrogenophilales bacterium 16-61-112]OZA46116.1 MAG: [acyl-carrier-protein] S-malonyltransferase [Hydrogenophilales bacterium 17-61-76]HQT31030.1 ACP S-malonyltransferase [Thiobacillus sp.]HQT69129.1 ACP S-malonyltransferase [Thiobacillus sp.]